MITARKAAPIAFFEAEPVIEPAMGQLDETLTSAAVTGRRNARDAKSAAGAAAAARVVRHHRIRRAPAIGIGSLGRLDRLDVKTSKQTADRLGGGQTSNSGPSTSTHSTAIPRPAYFSAPMSEAAPAAFLVVVGVERTEIEQLPAIKIRDDFHDSRRLGRHVEVGEQALVLKSVAYSFSQAGRPAAW